MTTSVRALISVNSQYLPHSSMLWWVSVSERRLGHQSLSASSYCLSRREGVAPVSIFVLVRLYLSLRSVLDPSPEPPFALHLRVAGPKAV